jgi:DNA topoisomerase-1
MKEKILIVSEKDNTAKRIATILSGNSLKQIKIDTVPSYLFEKNGTQFQVIGLKGHIVKIDYPSKYRNWLAIDPIELIEAPLIKVISQKKIAKALKSAAEGASEVIIATDFDREGELIGVEALEKIYEVEPKVKVKRARFSSLTPIEINNSFSNLESIYDNLASAGAARQDIDLIWGATLTRFLSLASTRLGKKFLSVGRVQSPTLALIVDKEKERLAFVSIPYWQIKLKLEADGEQFNAEHKTERFLEEAKAKGAISKITDKATVESVTKTIKEIKPPGPFNTTAFLSAASSLGIGPAAAMSIAEHLYMQGYISYPRVDNTVYPESMDLLEIVKKLTESSEFGNLASKILKQEKIVPTRGKKMATDHPPIHPTDVISKDKLGSREWRIYELVVRRYLATLSGSAKQESVKAEIDCGGEPLVAKGNRILIEGWLEFYHYSRRKEEELPRLEKGQLVDVLDKVMESKQTQPPGRYGQGRLIEEMEKLGLGTKATRHAIIQNLYERGYVHSDPLIPTETGIAVVEALQKHAETITSPKMTADLENSMDLIADDKLNKENVVTDSRKMLLKIMKVLNEKKEKVGEELRSGIKLDQIIGECPNCTKPLRIIRAKKTKKRFVGCSGYPDCVTSFPLPQFGGIIPTGEKCEFCNSPKIKVISKGSRPWELCINPSCPSKKEQAKKA